jgi:very-short-patch-repair endonuclease
MRRKVDTSVWGREIARNAERQHGLITTAQLTAIGLSSAAISRLVHTGRIHRIYRGVYAVGHKRLTREGWWLAAVFACGHGAVLSHRSAAALWGMRPQSSGPVDVAVPSRSGRAKRSGLRIHRPTCLGPSNTTRTQGIPVTTPARTISDLRRILSREDLNAAIRRAETLRLDIGPQPGYLPDRTRSELERMLMAVCRRCRLPMPEVNVWVGPYQVDFLWRDRRLIIEADSYKHHGTRSAFESDRERDVRLRLMGFTCLRFTHRQVSDARAFEATLEALLETTA